MMLIPLTDEFVFLIMFVGMIPKLNIYLSNQRLDSNIGSIAKHNTARTWIFNNDNRQTCFIIALVTAIWQINIASRLLLSFFNK